MKNRLDVNSFNFPVDKIKAGYYADKYFLRAAEILTKDDYNPMVLMQVFQRSNARVCGLDESIALLKTCAYNPENLKIYALHDGDYVTPWETVMTIEGNYRDFVHLETIYLGTLARQTRICTNVDLAVKAARGKSVLFFAARYDHYAVQESDGYAARVGGITAVSTDANGHLINLSGVGTMPHALIACYNKDTVAANLAFEKHISTDIDRVALVDFDNDCVNTSIAVAKALKGKLKAVRLDTSGTMVDKSMIEHMGMINPTGVVPQLVHNVRNALDREGFPEVKIMVSGGFNHNKIREFEDAKVPVDTYAVGSSLLDGRADFTADIVTVNGNPAAKSGRVYRPNPRMQRVL